MGLVISLGIFLLLLKYNFPTLFQSTVVLTLRFYYLIILLLYSGVSPILKYYYKIINIIIQNNKYKRKIVFKINIFFRILHILNMHNTA